MLKLKINRKNTRLTYSPILFGENDGHHISHNSVESSLTVETSTSINKSHNDSVHFIRKDGSIYFHDSRKISSLTENSVILQDFPFFGLKINSAERVDGIREYPGRSASSYLKITFSGNHNNTVNRDGLRMAEYMANGGNFSNDYMPKRCPGDYFIYGWFIYEIMSVNNGVYNFGDAIRKNLSIRVRVYDDSFRDGYEDLNCIVPVDQYGKDMLDTAIVKFSATSKAISSIMNNSYTKIEVEDKRFYDIKSGCVTLRNGTGLFLECGNIRFSIPIAEDFTTTMFAENSFEEYSTLRAESLVNKIVDYEKAMFIPSYYDGGTKLCTKIKYNIHLRDRIDGATGLLTEDWTTSDEKLWFAYSGFSGGQLISTRGGDTSDLAGDLGMDDDDIYYQKNKVKNTFLRLSFYDTNDRRTQQLLYTAKLYLDSGKLYGKYIKNVWSTGNDADIEYCKSSDFGENNLYVDFTCSNRLDNEYTSEGFYLYLFPSNLKDGERGVIYMKAEFNNAKYGYTIPLTLPLAKNSEDELKTAEIVPVGYIEKDGGKMYADMVSLNTDMFIPIEIFKEDGKYYWQFMFDFDSNRGDIEITLYEPRINGFKDGSDL